MTWAYAGAELDLRNLVAGVQLPLGPRFYIMLTLSGAVGVGYFPAVILK